MENKGLCLYMFCQCCDFVKGDPVLLLCVLGAIFWHYWFQFSWQKCLSIFGRIFCLSHHQPIFDSHLPCLWKRKKKKEKKIKNVHKDRRNNLVYCLGPMKQLPFVFSLMCTDTQIENLFKTCLEAGQKTELNRALFKACLRAKNLKR